MTGKMELPLTDLENTVGGASLWRDHQEFILKVLIMTCQLDIQVEMLSRCYSIVISMWMMIQGLEDFAYPEAHKLPIRLWLMKSRKFGDYPFNLCFNQLSKNSGT